MGVKGRQNGVWAGKYFSSKRYVYKRAVDHPGANSNGYVREHTLIVEERIGRFLEKHKEVVHHIDGNPSNNNPDNLMLVTHAEHRRIHNGWIQIRGEWHKKCSYCGVMKHAKDNFYKRKTGRIKYVNNCMDCARIINAQRKGDGEYLKRTRELRLLKRVFV
jgi:hypothetical protein